MVKDAGKAKFDVVMVWAIDRLGHLLLALHTTIHHFEACKPTYSSNNSTSTQQHEWASASTDARLNRPRHSPDLNKRTCRLCLPMVFDAARRDLVRCPGRSQSLANYVIARPCFSLWPTNVRVSGGGRPAFSIWARSASLRVPMRAPSAAISTPPLRA